MYLPNETTEMLGVTWEELKSFVDTLPIIDVYRVFVAIGDEITTNSFKEYKLDFYQCLDRLDNKDKKVVQIFLSNIDDLPPPEYLLKFLQYYSHQMDSLDSQFEERLYASFQPVFKYAEVKNKVVNIFNDYVWEYRRKEADMFFDLLETLQEQFKSVVKQNPDIQNTHAIWEIFCQRYQYDKIDVLRSQIMTSILC
jgi:hypothetical protein